MKIEAVAVRNFRSLKRASLERCSDVNVLIGKNNAGKSSILAAIEFAFDFIGQDAITSPWSARGRPADEISGRNQQALVQIGIQLKISPEQCVFIRGAVASEVEGVEVALKALENQEHLTLIVAGRFHDGSLSKCIQEIAVGNLVDSGDRLTTDGTKLLLIPDDAALELIIGDRRIERLRSTIDQLGNAVTEVNRSPVWRQRERAERNELRYYVRNFGFASDIIRRLEPLLEAASTPDELTNSVNSLSNELRSEISKIQDEPLKEALQSFIGAVRKPPPYVQPILRAIRESSLLHFKETRQAIGPREAEQLLKLKTTRGGPERLASLQTTVRSLLGVAVDAFDSDEGSVSPTRQGRSAEIDIDEFLVEANGAGIREALRIILDLELERPAFALIEEPEVHLHPGLEKVLHRYLVEKGSSCQVFVATHSTNFIDVSTRQNVYLVSRDKERNSRVELAINEDDVLKIPGDIGVRPSSVLMFDRLLFVEGPSDEAVVLTFAKSLEIDLSAVGLGIVQMGGASNSQHFASEATLSLLSRRQIPMTFLLDRDERDEAEIDKAAKRLGERATMHWLKKRELENYLLVPSAVQRLIEIKLATSSGRVPVPSAAEVAAAISEEADKLKASVSSRMISKALMTPVYIDRLDGESHSDKLASALAQITTRIEKFNNDVARLDGELTARWAGNAPSLAPGSAILTAVLQRFGLNYNKTGDAGRLASCLAKDDIDREIKDLLFGISKPT